MLEIEIKAKLQDRACTVQALTKAGFCYVETVQENDVYFNGIERDFAKTDEALRIRTYSGAEGVRCAAVTYKGPKCQSKAKARKELETNVEDGQRMYEIMLALGYKPVEEVRKERGYYKKGNITACVDNVVGLGDFLELESIAPDEAASAQSASERLFQILDELGVAREACTQKSYLEQLLLAKEKKA